MRKVVDTNFRQSPKLKEYLAKSPKNFVVLTDYSAMEVYKGNTLASIYRSMEILRLFPRQVIVLRSTTFVCGMRGRKAGLQRRLIDEAQTRGFDDFCSHLKQAEAGNLALQARITELGREATSHLDRVYQDALDFTSIFADLATDYTTEELKAFRTRSLFEIDNSANIAKIIKGIFGLFLSLFQKHPRATFKPSREEIYLICSYFA